jgi:mono/diheme cytochrome c family protein
MDSTHGGFGLIWVIAAFAMFEVGARALHAAAPDSPAGKTPPPATWARVSVKLPTSPTLFPPGEGADIANSYCLICHSAGMVLLQPALSQDEWTTEINKMRNAYGAPLPAEKVQALAKYLRTITDARHQAGPGTLDRS